jgi:hypothetical protein
VLDLVPNARSASVHNRWGNRNLILLTLHIYANLGVKERERSLKSDHF